MSELNNGHYLDAIGLSTLWGKIKNKFQAQEAGKGLSSNDYTDSEKSKLSGIEEGAQVNVQSDWGQSDTTADDYIANKPSIYTKSEIDDILSANVKYSVVSKLPATGTAGTIYLVPSGRQEEGNVYDEYMWVGAKGSVPAHFELIGTTETDISSKQDIIKAIGGTTKPIYFSADGVASECSTYAGGTRVTLNGTAKGGTTASMYAPTSAGTSGQYLKSNGSGSPSWETLDTKPTPNSTKAVSSGGVNTALSEKVNVSDYLTDKEIDDICV